MVRAGSHLSHAGPVKPALHAHLPVAALHTPFPAHGTACACGEAPSAAALATHAVPVGQASCEQSAPRKPGRHTHWLLLEHVPWPWQKDAHWLELRPASRSKRRGRAGSPIVACGAVKQRGGARTSYIVLGNPLALPLPVPVAV
jgi:hypothetical protein